MLVYYINIIIHLQTIANLNLYTPKSNLDDRKLLVNCIIVFSSLKTYMIIIIMCPKRFF